MSPIFSTGPLGGALCAGAAAGAQKEELQALRGRIEVLGKQLAAAEESKNEAVDALQESERAISESNRVLRELAAKQRAVNARLTALQDQRRLAVADIDGQKARLAQLLYQQYIGAQPDALKLLLNRDDPNRIARELHYLTHLSRARAELIRSLRSNLGRLNELEGATRDRKSVVEGKRGDLGGRRIIKKKKTAYEV